MGYGSSSEGCHAARRAEQRAATVFAGMLLSGDGFVIAHSTLQTRATELAPEQRGTAVAIFAFALFLGGGLGTALAGLVIERAGYEVAILGTAALLAVFAVLSGALLRRYQPPRR